MVLVSEGKIIINVDETVKANHPSIIPKKKECSMLKTIPSSIFLQFRSFNLVEIDFPRKTLKGSLGTDNKAKGNDDDGWTLVSCKKKRHQAVLRIRLHKPRVIKNNAEHIRPPKSIKFDTSKKIDGALSRKDRRPITLYEFFSKKFLEDSIIGATHIISSTEEVIESKGGHGPMIAQEFHANKPLFVVGAIQKQHLNCILIDDDAIYLDSCELGMEKPTLSNPINVVAKEVEVQWASVKMTKERIEKFSTKPSSSEGDMHTKMDEEHILKGGTTLAEIIQVPSIMPELRGSNTLAHKIKEAQMKLRKQGHYVAIPKFGLGFKLLESLRISTKKGKETTSSHYSSVLKDKEFEDEKIPQQTFVFERLGRLTPRVSIFERLGCKGKSRASIQMKEEANTSRGSVF
ncbi:hypothetical protein CQW23_15333 [Capsicum baccatum]|uniref:Uncharacterized protein n=1 Tax=Capsicum baccatum TaxID=33114 RepID=A0A2G2WLR2_CAPBA|nr:hypothetical protein CQW23_15333 [Capsicum baccatum]